ncbi:MAG: response regulator [Kofleriaceae bacterium]
MGLAHLAGETGALVWYVDDDRLEVDEATERLLGLRRGMLGKTVADLMQRIRESSRDGITAALERALAGATLVEVDLVVDLPSGSTRHLGLRATLVHEPERVIGAIHEITELVELRAELASARQALAARDAELVRTTAAHANLAGGISRDIRTHLDAILGTSQLLVGTALASDQRERIATIQHSGVELLGSVRDLLDVAGTDPAVALAPVSIASVIAAAAAALGRDTRVRLHTEIALDVPPVLHVDAARLRRIVRHVLASALGLGPVEELAIAARTRRLGGTLHELAIEVRTCCPGISAQRSARLVDGTDPEGPVGIAIAGKLLARLGGRLAVTSQLAGTTSLLFTIPVDEAQPTDAAAPESLDLGLGAHHPLRILVADDHPTSRKITGAFLERLGYHPRFAGDGRQAVEAIRHERFDVVFMDVQMPVMDGLAAARLVRQLGPRAEVPRIIALTANALPHDRAACFAAGCDDYLTKPVSIEALCGALRGSPRITRALDPAAVDLRVLADLESMLEPAIVDELLATYDSDGRELVATLASALARADATALARAAHNLKSTSAALGARPLGATCEQLELDTRSGRLERAAVLVDTATRQLAEVRSYLAEHRRRAPPEARRGEKRREEARRGVKRRDEASRAQWPADGSSRRWDRFSNRV